MGKFGLGVQNEAGQRLIEFCQGNTVVIANILFQQHKKDATHGHHQMVNTKITLIIFFAAKDGEALYSQQNKTGKFHIYVLVYCIAVFRSDLLHSV